jgi:HK97 family phage prohead protease
MITNFPQEGDDKPVSLANSQWPLFPVGEAQALKDDWPAIWAEGGNVRGNQQFALLAPMASERRGPRTPAEEEAVRLREAWIARHRGDFRLPGIVAQVKWLAVSERGLEHMRSVIEEAKASQNEKRTLAASFVSRKDGYEEEGAAQPIYTFLITTGAVDRQNEQVDPAGWDFTAYAKNPVILDNHRYESIEDILGRALLPIRPVSNGWEVDILLSSCENGRHAARLIDEGMLNAVSVGFRSLEREREGTMTIHRRQELLEISLVSIPANPEAIRIRAALPFSDLPIADPMTAWDGSMARQRVQAFAGAEGSDFSKMDWSKYADAFLWVNPDAKEQDGGYKLIIADVIDGELQAVPRAIYAAAAALAGARFGVDLPEADRAGVAELLGQWYDRIEKPLPPSVEQQQGMMADEMQQEAACKPQDQMKAGRVLSRANADLVRQIRENATQMVEALDMLLSQLPGEADVVPNPDYPPEAEADSLKAADEAGVVAKMAEIAAQLAALTV